MEALFTFIIKSGALLILFYCAYYFLLRKETFFNNNRWFLLAGLFTSVILPFIVYTKIVWVDATPISNNIDFQFSTPQSNTNIDIDWNLALIAIYSIGLLALLIKFAIDFYSLNSVLKGKKVKQQADFKFVDISENIAPFSYFDYIVYNSSLYSASELESILEHEKVHSEQNHTIDVLVSRIFCVLFWFNPIVWLYKKAILQNLEFIADSEAARKISDKKAYQYTLLKITTHENCVAITNHFYQSLIKKRIIMLNKNQSKKRNLWKFYVVIPVLAAFVFLFQIKTEAKEKQQVIKEASGEIKSVDVYKIKKTTTDAELKEIKEKLKAIHNVDFVTSEIKRNADNDLTSIKIDVKNGNQQSQSVQTGNQTIKDFGIIVTTDHNGNKKVGIQTGDETDENPKIIKEKKQKTKLKTNDSTNSTVSTKTNTNSNTNSETTIVTSSDDNNSTTKITTKDGGSMIVVSNSGKNDSNSKKLVIIDGVEMPATFSFDDYKSGDIKTMNVLKGDMAIAKYGDKGKNGVIIIETRK
ncbi:peptidase M56 [Flavobacterium sp. Leaf82]|uniref:M56 family metallopeptidase n=1 Tax=unclassified Flavobacterium TaxID=196869 RepID=UPI0006FB7926|nr:M56 family metallopeptidase [Flavobacterium sp. Leaf82]KQO21327.1 peptidase M56 [Flavobacterium sp. Leaf82]